MAIWGIMLGGTHWVYKWTVQEESWPCTLMISIGTQLYHKLVFRLFSILLFLRIGPRYNLYMQKIKAVGTFLYKLIPNSSFFIYFLHLSLFFLQVLKTLIIFALLLWDLCKTLPHPLSFLFLSTIGSPAVNIFDF